MRARLRPVAALLTVALGLVAVAPPPGADATALQRPRFTREQMRAAQLPGERFLCVYGTADPSATPTLRDVALMLATRLFGVDSARVLPDTAVGAGQLTQNPVLLVGGPHENAWTARCAPGLPVRFLAHAFEWGGTRYDLPGDAIHLVYPNPLAPNRLVLVIAGNAPAAVARRSGDLIFGDQDWRITRDGDLARSGRFAMTPQPWSYLPALDHDRERERLEYTRALVRSGPDPEGVEVLAPASLGAFAAAASRAAGRIARELERTGMIAPVRAPGTRRLTLTLYPTLERKGVLVGDTRPEHLDARAQAHAALAAGRTQLDLWSVAAGLLVSAGADRGSRFLIPAGVWWAGRFEGEPLPAAVSRLYFARLWPRADEIASRPLDWRSPLIRHPAQAVLLAAVGDVAGPRRVDAIWALLRSDPPGSLDSVCAVAAVDAWKVERRYTQIADSLARVGVVEARRRVPRAWRPSDGFQRGVGLAHQLDLEQGYLSHACDDQLDRLAGMGAEWVVLTPVATMPSLHSPELLPSGAAGVDAETDEAVCEAAARAHRRGLKVWLAPRVWSRGWTGVLDLTPAGWNTFDERYREFVIHQALLAQRERIDGLMIGRQMASATAREPDRWRAWIAAVRRVYDGSVTYAAGGDEVARVGFWDALDAIGVCFDRPLADQATVDVHRLRAGAERSLAGLRALGEAAGRPVLIAEAGYAPFSEAPLRPWDEPHGAIDLDTQRACYEALVQALDRELGVAGVMWRSWPTADSAGGPSDGSITPRGKPAEQVMRRALQSWRDRPVVVPHR